MGGPSRLAITKYLLTAKPDREARGRRAILSDVLTPDLGLLERLISPLERIANCDDARDALADEAQAAKYYWRAWRD